MVLSLARRRSGEQLGTPSVSSRPQMFTSRPRSPRPFSCSVSLPLSPVKGRIKKKKRTGSAVFQLWNWLFFCQLLSCAFPRFIPDVANLEWRRQSYAERIQWAVRIEILVFLKGFLNAMVSSPLQKSLYYGVKFGVFKDHRLKQLCIQGKQTNDVWLAWFVFYGEANVGTQGRFRRQRWLIRNKRSRRTANHLAGGKREKCFNQRGRFAN